VIIVEGSQLNQLGTGVDETIDAAMALGEGIDLVRPIDCARLSFQTRRW
jgi:hypothetical protein